MKWFSIGVIFFSLFISSANLTAQTDNHTVTVTVVAINEVGITGGNLTLTINTATAGSNPDSQTDNTTCDLNWTTNQASKKITVGTSIVTPSFTLTVEAKNVSGGTAAGVITLSGASAQDFVTGVATTLGTADLEYIGSATAAQGSGSDAHTVTYTITDV